MQEVVSSNLTSPTTNFDFGMTEFRLPTASAPDRLHLIPDSGRASVRAAIWALAIAGLIFYASSRAHVASPGITKIDDKFAHFAVYGLLGTLVCRMGNGWRAAAWSFLIVAAYGASDEWHQSFVPGRSTEFEDWIADTVGAAVAIVFYTGWSSYRIGSPR